MIVNKGLTSHLLKFDKFSGKYNMVKTIWTCIETACYELKGLSKLLQHMCVTERPPDFLGPALQYPHEAVGVGVVVDGGHGPLWPAHQDQVEVSVSCQQMAGHYATKK